MFKSNEIEFYLTNSQMQSYKKRVDNAINIVYKTLKTSSFPSLSFSGGKDSIVLLDIAIKAGFRGSLNFFKYGIVDDIETPKENIDILKYYVGKYNIDYNIINCLGEVDCWEQCGRFTLFPETDEEKRIFNKTNFDFAKKSAAFEAEHNIDLSIIGMRKDESKKRRIILNKKGAVYTTKSRQSVTCCPLLNFKDDDIWTYIFDNNLKYLSIYDYKYLNRNKIRNEITMLYNDEILGHGMLWHYKQMYPDFFRWLTERWGNIGL